MILSGPGINKNQKSDDAPIELIDIYPTLMELVGMKTPEFVSGKSFALILKDSSARVRTSALTELGVSLNSKSKVQGYTIKTDRYRLTQWGDNGSHGYELYDHMFDKKELKNLSDIESYKKIQDSLKIVINNRIVEARKIPKGLGEQIDNAKQWKEPKWIHSRPK